MPDTQRPQAALSRAQQLAALLVSTYVEPNRKAFAFAEGKLHVVARLLWDDNPRVLAFRPGLLWVYELPQGEHHTDLWWEPEYAADEQRAHLELSRVDAEEAARAFACVLAEHRQPKR